jgi:hypothetical protein
MSTEKILEELRARQRRLGTAEELPGDLTEARDLAHQINNQRTVELLGQFVKDTAQPFEKSDTTPPM